MINCAEIAKDVERNSLRDYFAAAALNGMLSYSANDTNGNITNNCNAINAACIAYEYADAMLTARAMKVEAPNA